MPEASVKASSTPSNPCMPAAAALPKDNKEGLGFRVVLGCYTESSQELVAAFSTYRVQGQILHAELPLISLGDAQADGICSILRKYARPRHSPAVNSAKSHTLHYLLPIFIFQSPVVTLNCHLVIQDDLPPCEPCGKCHILSPNAMNTVLIQTWQNRVETYLPSGQAPGPKKTLYKASRLPAENFKGETEAEGTRASPLQTWKVELRVLGQQEDTWGSSLGLPVLSLYSTRHL